MNRIDFDVSKYGYSKNESEPVPKNDYLLLLISIETKISNKTGGQYEVFKWKINDGEFLGKFIYSNLNLYHADEQTQNIARGTLRTIAKCMSKEEQLNEKKDVQILKEGEVCAHVDIREYQGAYFNEIKVYKIKDKYVSQSVTQKSFQDDTIPF